MGSSRLAGYWTDKILYPGDMEASDVAFRPDGVGWVYWYNAAGAFTVLRFAWRDTEGKRLTLDLKGEASGSWRMDGSTVSHHVDRQTVSFERLAMTYEVVAGQDAAGSPVTILDFDRHVIVGVTGSRFALERKIAHDECDPAGVSGTTLAQRPGYRPRMRPAASTDRLSEALKELRDEERW
jgi:hypothetical protein